MRLIGFEVLGYAGLDQQFVPLQPGLNVVSGKNNSGKSSLLLAAAVLTPDHEALQYARPNSSQFRVIAQLEKDDPGFEYKDPGQSPLSNEGTSVAFCYTMRASGKPQFTRVEVLDRPEITDAWIESAPNPTNSPSLDPRTVYSFNSQGRRVHSWEVRNSLSHQYPFLKIFENACYIRPHRVSMRFNEARQQTDLASDGTTLANYLHNLRGNNSKMFRKIEDELRSMFPEFDEILTNMEDRNVSVSMRHTDGQEIPLSLCGTGVEQSIVLLSSLFDSRVGELILLDEPQSFLHPTIERRLADLCATSTDKIVLAATHSPVILNSVTPDRVTHVKRPGLGFSSYLSEHRGSDIASILHSLGYRNSDFLFHDRLLFLEGKSDPLIFKSLALQANPDTQGFLASTGMPVLEGTREVTDFEDLQLALIREEHMLREIGRITIPHAYLFDRDRAKYEERLNQTRPSGNHIRYLFLHRREIENYLLNAEAVAPAIEKELISADVDRRVTSDEVGNRINQLLTTDASDERTFKKLFPDGRKGLPLHEVKGSTLLDILYGDYLLKYDKVKSGALIAEFITLGSDAKAEINATLSELIKALEEAG